MNKLKKALEKLLDAAHPAYVSDNHFQKKLIAARDNAFQELESHRLDMEDHIADAGEMVSLRDQFAVAALQGIMTNPGGPIQESGSKPRYCNGVELDECLIEAPELGTNYYYPDPMHVDYYNLKPWVGDADDIYWFELGFAYGSSESAAKHGHAMGITTEG